VVRVTNLFLSVVYMHVHIMSCHSVWDLLRLAPTTLYMYAYAKDFCIAVKPDPARCKTCRIAT